MSEAQKNRNHLWQLIRRGRPSVAAFSVAVLAALGSVAGSLWFPIQTKHLIDQFNGGGIDLRQVALVAAVLTGDRKSVV